MIAAYQRISRADGDLGKDGKDKSNSIENQKELIQRYISCKESLQNVPVMDFVDDGYTGSNFDRPGFQQMILLFLIFSTITIEKSQMHSSEFGGYTSSSRVF